MEALIELPYLATPDEHAMLAAYLQAIRESGVGLPPDVEGGL